MKVKIWLIISSLVLMTWMSQAADFQEEPLKLAETYSNQVVQYYQQGLLNKALPLAEKAFQLRKEILGIKHPETLTSLNNLAVIYQAVGQLSEALPLFKQGYALRQEILGAEHPETLISLNNLAVIYHVIGKLSKALSLSENGYRLRKELLGDKHPDTLASLINLATLYQDVGRLLEALSLFEQGYALYKEILGPEHPETLISLNNLAFSYQDVGRLSEALPLFELSYARSREILGEKHPQTLISLHNLAAIYQSVGRFSEALPLYERGYVLRQEVLGTKHPDTLKSLNNLAGIYQNVERFSEALSLFEQGYALHQEVFGEKHPETLTSLNNLASIYRVIGRFSEALPLFKKGYILHQEVLGAKHPKTLGSLNNLADIYKTIGKLSEALPLYKKGYALRQEVLGAKHPKTLSSLGNLAFTYSQQGQINQAIKHFETFVIYLEDLRQSYLSAETRQALFKQWVSGYFTLAALYLGQSRFQEAFHLAEMSKSRTLLESLTTQLAVQQSELTIAEQQKWQEYEVHLAFLNNRIAKYIENNNLKEKNLLEIEKNLLVNKRRQFHHELMAKYPKYAKLSQVQIIDTKIGAKELTKNAVFISYLFQKNYVLAFTLQADGTLTAHSLGEISHLSEKLNCYRYQVSRGRGRIVPLKPKTCTNMESVSRELGKILLEPLFEQIKDQTHWIISPNGPLALIPFEALFWNGEPQPIVAQYQISYVQSLSVLKLLRERETAYTHLENREVLLAMGAPLYKGTGTAKNKGNPSRVNFKIARQMVRRGGDYTGAFERLGSVWQDLPGAKKELEQLEKLFKETQPRIYKQASATEAKLQTLNQQGILAQYRYLVFSTHGHLNLQIPQLSSIVLGQVNNPPKIDGYVTAGEWPGYDLKSDLMVLSACETGLGKTVAGEGVMGLPYAFYVAGNKNTILTLWTISDEVTVEFITAFFTKLKAGMRQVEALTATKREFLRKGKPYSNPVYWAAFVLYGF